MPPPPEEPKTPNQKTPDDPDVVADLCCRCSCFFLFKPFWRRNARRGHGRETQKNQGNENKTHNQNRKSTLHKNLPSIAFNTKNRTRQKTPEKSNILSTHLSGNRFPNGTYIRLTLVSGNQLRQPIDSRLHFDQEHRLKNQINRQSVKTGRRITVSSPLRLSIEKWIAWLPRVLDKRNGSNRCLFC